MGRNVSVDVGLKSSNPSDSIVYSLTSPMQTASYTFSYSGSYSYDKPLHYLAFPKTGQVFPRGFHLDSTTGILAFRPMKTEITVMAVKAEIFRNGVKLSESFRDMQFAVMKCPDNYPPQLSGLDTVAYDQYKKIVCADKMARFDVLSFDKNKRDTVQIEFKSGIGDSFNVVNPNDKRENGEWFWTPDSTEVGKEFQSFFVNAKDNSCPFPEESTIAYQIKVVNALPNYLSIEDEQIDQCGTYKFSLIDSVWFEYDRVTWYLNDTIEIGQGENIYYEFTDTGKQKISIDVVKCDSITLSKTINVNHAKTLDFNLNDIAICGDQIITLNPKIKGGNGNLTYSWYVHRDFNYKGSTSDTFITIDLENAKNGISDKISLSVKDTSNCILKKEITLTSKPVVQEDIDRQRVICYGSQDTLNLKTKNGKGSWVGNGISNNQVIPKNLTFGITDLFFRQENDSTCVIDTAKIIYYFLPEIEMITEDFTTCKGAPKTELEAKPATGAWSGFGISKSEFDPEISDTGTQSLVFRYTTFGGCSVEDSIKVQVFDYTPIVTITQSAEACENDDEITLTSTVDNGLWTGTSIGSRANPLRILPADLNIGKNEFFYEFVDSNQCAFYDTSFVMINESPTPSFEIVNSNLTKGDTLQIINRTPNLDENDYSWEVGQPAIYTSNAKHFNFKTPNSTGVFDVKLLATHKSTVCNDSLIKTDAITIQPNSIGEKPYENAIYPNPVDQVIHIQSSLFTDSGYKIYNMSGAKVQQGVIVNNQIKVLQLPKGIYRLKIRNNQEILDLNFIKN
ncbi:MAG: T9SS type A sorting domain-containing protein [Bacteroidia bacterium]